MLVLVLDLDLKLMPEKGGCLLKRNMAMVITMNGEKNPARVLGFTSPGINKCTPLALGKGTASFGI